MGHKIPDGKGIALAIWKVKPWRGMGRLSTLGGEFLKGEPCPRLSLTTTKFLFLHQRFIPLLTNNIHVITQ